MNKTVITLLHVGYWILYLLLWSILLLLMFMGGGLLTESQGWRIVGLIASFGFIPAVMGFYAYYGWLFPRYLQRHKIAAFFAAGIAVALLSGILSAVIITLFFPDFSFFNQGLYSAGPITGILAIVALLNGCTGLVIKGFISWYTEVKLKESLSRKNFEMELALVKSQINPHFLFNTLNNIDVLIGKDAARASLYLNKLSDIMRFMLYETKTEKIPLSKELEYIEKYIDLQRIRTAVPNYVQYELKGELNHQLIEPMLFIPLVENAFKHSAIREKENAIHISIHITDDGLEFVCRNKYKEGAPNTPEYGGLGNTLIQKRLMALYPNKHKLEITKNGDTYCVKLTLLQAWRLPVSS